MSVIIDAQRKSLCVLSYIFLLEYSSVYVVDYSECFITDARVSLRSL